MQNDDYINREIKKYILKYPSLESNKLETEYLELICQYLTKTQKKSVIKKVIKLMSEQVIYIDPRRKIKPEDHGLDQNIIENQWWCEKMESFYRKSPNRYYQVQAEILKYIEISLRKPTKKSRYLEKLQQVKSTFKLDDKECDIITFFYINEQNKAVQFLFYNRLDMDELTKSVWCYQKLFDINRACMQQYFCPTSKLHKTGILEKNNRGRLDIDPAIYSFLAGYSEQNIIDSFLNRIDLTKASGHALLSLSAYPFKSESINVIKNLIDSRVGVNILLHGEPGTGKTEFTKSLAKRLNKRLYFVKQKDTLGEESQSYRKTSIIAALHLLDPEQDILVIDECDEVINLNHHHFLFKAQSRDKAWLNDLLETTPQKIIWISNRINDIDESTKRRYSYSLEFNRFNQKQRLTAWQNQVKSQKVDYIKSELIEVYSEQYRINPGSISLALRDVNAAKLKDPQEKRQLLEELLRQHQSFIYGQQSTSNTTQKYSLEALNTDQDLKKIINICQKFIQFNTDNTTPSIQNMNILLQGAPGTGKTEFVKYLTQQLKKEMILKRLSDIRSPWYGLSLINIAKMFKEAQSKEAILFLDEADSFFTSRETSSDHYAAETNELLTQMENFKGILICATNFRTKMDHASIRRFNFKINFDYLSPAGKVKLFQHFFQIEKLTSAQIARLSRIPSLTPGDFKVVFQKNFFLDKSKADELLSELEQEVKYKNEVTKSMGLV